MIDFDVELKARRATSPGLVVRLLVQAANDESAVGVAVGEATRRYPEELGWDVESSVEITRPCRFCGAQVTSRDESCDFCRGCYYAGRHHAMQPEVMAMMAALERIDGIKPDTVGVWHTGGGCFALGGSFVDDSYFMVTDGQAGIDEGPWVVGYYQDDDDCEGTPHRPDWHPDLAGPEEVVEAVVRLRSSEGGP